MTMRTQHAAQFRILEPQHMALLCMPVSRCSMLAGLHLRSLEFRLGELQLRLIYALYLERRIAVPLVEAQAGVRGGDFWLSILL